MNLEECFSQIDSCEFECEGGPLRLNVGYIGLKSNIAELEQQLAELREALTRIRDCDWVITLPDRMDAVREIAREALDQSQEQTP